MRKPMNDLVRKAAAYATSAHGGQTYGDMPYHYHLSMVVAALKAATVTDPEILAAGWLHDVVEDTDRTVEDIREVFGDRIARLVDCCTGVGHNRKTRNANIAEKCAAAGNMDAVLVKFADRVANLQSLTATLRTPADRVDPEEKAKANSLSKMYRKEMEVFLDMAEPHIAGPPLPPETVQAYVLLQKELVDLC